MTNEAREQEFLTPEVKKAIAIQVICYEIFNRREDKPINDCAEKILKRLEAEFGYRSRSKLTLITDEEISHVELPTYEEVKSFRDNPENTFGETTLVLKTLAAAMIVYAKAVARAQLDHDREG